MFPEHCTTAVLTSLIPALRNTITVEAVKRRINEGLLTAELPALTNPYTEKEATKQQQEDLMNFREIGEKEFEKYVEYNILHKPSTKTPNRKRKLLTFSHCKANKAHSNQLERDKQLVMKCLQKRLKWYQQTGKPVEKLAEQYIPFPLAISDNKGNPIKGQKSFTTKVFETRYTDSPYPVIMNIIPSNLTPQCVVLEGMFLINTSPLRTHTTFGDYAFFLMRRFILSQFNNMCREVHILFDNPGRLQLPKTFERQRQDATATVIAHTCDTINTTMPIPPKWRDSVINCRTCKRSISSQLLVTQGITISTEQHGPICCRGV